MSQAVSLDGVRLTDPANFESVVCVCGHVANLSVGTDGKTRTVTINVSCDHGGKSRSYDIAYNEIAKYSFETVRDHVLAGAPIAPLGGSKLGNNRTWKPATSPIPPIAKDYASISPSKVAGFTQAARGALRRFPRSTPAHELNTGDVVENQSRTPTELTVVLAVGVVGPKLKLTLRRLSDDKYMSLVVDPSTAMRVLADVAATKGDPNQWVADSEELAKQLRDDADKLKAVQNAAIAARPADQWLEKTAIEKSFEEDVYKGDIVEIVHGDGRGCDAEVLAVTCMSMQSSSYMFYDCMVLHSRNGWKAGQRVTCEKHQIKVIARAHTDRAVAKRSPG